MGARPMKRVIQEQIKHPLADDLLFGKLATGGIVNVYAPGEQDKTEDQEKLVLEVTANKVEPKALPASAD